MRLLDCCKIDNQSVSKYEGTKKYIATGDIINNNIVTYEEYHYDSKPSRANLQIEEETVIFAKMKDTIKVLIGNKDNKNNIYSTGFCSLIPNDNILSKYLFYYLNSESFNKQKNKYSSGATQQAINNEKLKKIMIKELPTLKKQKEIINKLDTIMSLIEYKKRQIHKLNELIKSQFVEMFGTNKKTKYPFDSLNNLSLKITDGKHGGCNGEENSGYYFVGATEIYNDKINYQTAKEITQNDFEKDYKRCDLKNNDFVIVNTGATIGKSAIVNSSLSDHTLLQKSVALIRPKQELISPIYLKYCYDANPDMYNKGNGCARINLLLSQIKETMIPVPPLDLQNKFADIVKQIDKQKFVIENSLENIGKLVDLW